jgi:small subunit ribosomal protein S1
MSVMTDHERRDEGAEPGLLNELLSTAETTTAEAEATEVPVPAPQQTADENLQEQEASAAEASAEEAPAAEGASEDNGEGASYTPVAEEDGKPRRMKDLEVGMELEGRVTSIALYGIFVDIGVGRDGLVHISEMSDTRIDSPSDVVQIGDTVKVRIKSLDPEARRISLTMRSQRERRRGGQRRPDINRDALTGLKAGDTIEGTITGIAPFGVFVDIGVGKDGLVHVSELSEGRVERPEDAVQVGERYTFKMLEVDPEGTRISLSLRKAQRQQKLQQLEPGAIMDGTVSGLAPFGAFVDIGVGRDGLVHISELSDQRVGKVEDAVKPGDKVKVRVLEVDPQSKRISLTMRLEDRPREVQPQDDSAPASTVVPRTGPGAAARFANVTATEERRSRRSDRNERGDRSRRPVLTGTTEAYATADDSEEEFTGNATLEDLLSKFGGQNRKDRRFQPEEEEDGGDRQTSRRQRDAIRRTLQSVGDDE